MAITVRQIYLFVFSMALAARKPSKASIAGLTYMDDHDFGARYQDAYECDPLYWHPLHLPEHCARMYEKLIRSRLSSPRSLRLKHYRNRWYPDPYHRIDSIDPYYRADSVEIPQYDTDVDTRRKLTSQDKMIKSFYIDIMNVPSEPVIGMSNVGPVAIYHQPISKISEKRIMSLAKRGRKRKSKRGKGRLKKKVKEFIRKNSLTNKYKEDEYVSIYTNINNNNTQW